jgi:hypothetical protein
MRTSVQQNFVQFTKPLEALALPFVHNTDDTPASQSEIQAEWAKVKQNTSLSQQGYKAAAPPFTTLHLTDAGITQLVTNQLNANQATLTQTFPDFDSWPADAQLGVLSMTWALGAGGPLIILRTFRDGRH